MTMQRTLEWHEQKLGKPSASRFKDISYTDAWVKMLAEKDMTEEEKKKKRKKPRKTEVEKWMKGTATYMLELLAERLIGVWQEAYGNAIEWGNTYEDEAREAYEKRTGTQVHQVGFIEENGIGSSPDGLVGTDGCIEIKCPYNSTNHIGYILNGPGDHMDQCQAAMYFNARAWCDFITYDPRMPAALQLHVTRIKRDEAYIAAMLERVDEFKRDLDELERRLRDEI